MSDIATRKQKFLGRLNAILLPRALDMLNFRINHYDRGVDPARPEYDGHVIFAFWHEYISVVLPRWGHTPLTCLVSKHRDGEWVNQTAVALGMNIVRGSTSRGGSAAIRQLKKFSKISSLTLTPDGPRGPRRQMAIGPVFLASLLKMPIVPVGVGISNPYRLNTWDRFAIPKPLSRVRMIFGPRINVPPKQGREKLEATRQSVQNLITGLSDEAERWAISGQKMVGEQPFVRARHCSSLVFPEPETPKLKIVRADDSRAA